MYPGGGMRKVGIFAMVASRNTSSLLVDEMSIASARSRKRRAESLKSVTAGSRTEPMGRRSAAWKNYPRPEAYCQLAAPLAGREAEVAELVMDMGLELARHVVGVAVTADQSGLRALVEKLDQELPPLIDSLKATSDRSEQTVVTAEQAIKALQDRLDTTLAAIGAVAATGNRQLDQRGAELHTLLATSNQTVLQVRDLLGNLQALTSERGQTRANIESTLRDLAAAAASLRGFASDLEHDPQLLLTGRRP